MAQKIAGYLTVGKNMNTGRSFKHWFDTLEAAKLDAKLAIDAEVYECRKAFCPNVDEDRVVKAASGYLQNIGCEVLWDWHNPDGKRWVAAKENGEVLIAFVTASCEGDEIPKPNVTREDFEEAMVGYFAHIPDSLDSCKIRFDTIDMLVIPDDRAVLRHHRNCLQDSE